MADTKLYAIIDYEDSYVQPLLMDALNARLPPEMLVLINDYSELPTPNVRLLQWQQYEKIDFEHLMSSPSTALANSYVIRKALIRKHYLAATISHWITKNPKSVLRQHAKPTIEFEVDFAEFLDDALLEAFELKESWAKNESSDSTDQEWWILKPGMSDRGQGIRLFHTEEELTSIFEEWDPPSDDEDTEDGDETTHSAANAELASENDDSSEGNGIVTSQLRHFIAQPYIDPPLLLPKPHPSANRKFHVRTYVLTVGALKVYVYKPMLALFAGKPYQSPKTSPSAPNESLPSHLTNTCLQTGEREGSIHAFWSLPSSLPGLTRATALDYSTPSDWREHVFGQICHCTAELFEAAARSMAIHFQPLPNAFELYGVDFMVDADGIAWLLEVNAFPDFAQTGEELQGLVKGLFEGCVDVAVKQFFGLESNLTEDTGDQGSKSREHLQMVEVLDIDLGRR